MLPFPCLHFHIAYVVCEYDILTFNSIYIFPTAILHGQKPASSHCDNIRVKAFSQRLLSIKDLLSN